MFLYSAWRSLSLPSRIKIASEFGIAKIGPTHVRDNYIESDGYKIEDVERALNIDAIQKYVGSDETDMSALFEMLVAKSEGRELPTLVPRKIEDEETETVETETVPEIVATPKRRGRPAKAK